MLPKLPKLFHPRRTIDITYISGDNEDVNFKQGTDAMLEELKKAVDDLLSHVTTVKDAVEAATGAPNVEQAIVDAVIAALEAQGYTVTAPAPPAAPEAVPAPEAETPAEEAAEPAEEPAPTA
jgi:hypothetical protein